MGCPSLNRLRRIVATYALSSPLFMGGADQQECRLSAEGFIGKLAFWWRAQAWEHLHHPSADDLDVAENHIFGSADGGSGIFEVVRVEIHGEKLGNHQPGQTYGPARNGRPERPRVAPCPAGYVGLFRAEANLWSERGSGINYLCGQGIKPNRVCFASPLAGEAAILEVELLLKPKAGTDEIEGLLGALKLLGLVGGMGARSRRALGSLSLQSLIVRKDGSDTAHFTPPTSAEEFTKTLAALIPRYPEPGASLPHYTAISGLADWVCVDIRKNAAHALNWIGQHYQLFRGYGLGNGHHQVGGVRALHLDRGDPAYLFKTDHDWYKSIPPGQAATDQDILRAQFGLPLTFQSRTGPRVTINAVKGDDIARRASPLLLHLHRISENHHIAVALLLPAAFLPKGTKVRADASPRRSTNLTALNIDYAPLRALLGWIATSPCPPGGSPA